MHPLLPYIQCNAGFAHCNTGADHRVGADLELVPIGNHRLACLAVSSTQDGVFASLIHKEDACVIQAIGFANDVDGLRQ